MSTQRTRQGELESIITAVRGLEDGKLFLASHEASFDLHNIEDLFFCDLSLCFPARLSLAHIFRWDHDPSRLMKSLNAGRAGQLACLLARLPRGHDI